MSTKKQRAEQAEWTETLQGMIKPGDTVYTVLRHVSRSGMSRRIDLYIIGDDKRPHFITGMAAAAMGMRWDRDKGGIIAGGCGMDMGFHLVYNLSQVLFREGFVCTGERCPSNDHSNGDRDRTPHSHTDPGYALRHEWM